MPSTFLRAGCVLQHRNSGAGTEYEAFEQGIAGQPICSMHAGSSGFTSGVQPANGGPSPGIGFHAAHHEMRGGADRSKVAREIETVAEASRVDARKALFKQLPGLASHVQVNVLAIRLVHFAGD